MGDGYVESQSACGALASQGWFLAFALETAARVRTLGLVEILFAQVLARQDVGRRHQRGDNIGKLVLAGEDAQVCPAAFVEREEVVGHPGQALVPGPRAVEQGRGDAGGGARGVRRARSAARGPHLDAQGQLGLPQLHRQRALRAHALEQGQNLFFGELEKIGGVVVAPRASELIFPVALAVHKRMHVDDLAETFTVYPSLAGSISEAARRLHTHL